MNYAMLAKCNREFIEREMWDEVYENIRVNKVKLSASERSVFS